MLSELFHSKNASAALILVFVGLLLATLVPAVMPFPGWAAGLIGLLLGGIAGVLAMQGRGANRDELLSIRTGIMAALRGERAARPAVLSPDLVQVFTATDELAAEFEVQRQRSRELESARDGLRTALQLRGKQLIEADDDLTRRIDALSAGFAEEFASLDRVGDSLHEISAAVQAVNGQIQLGAGVFEQLSSDFEHGTEALVRALHDMSPAERVAALPAQPSIALGASLQALRERTRVFGEIAEQGELLGLNAEITAAQAGGAGRGLAMIADQLKTLTARSAVSAEQLASLVEQLEEQLKRAEVTSGPSAGSSARGAQLSAEAEHALRKLVETSRKKSDAATGASRALTEHAQRGLHAADEGAQRLKRLREVLQEHENRLMDLTKLSERLHRLTETEDLP